MYDVQAFGFVEVKAIIAKGGKEVRVPFGV
jgi:hypothetical protein